LFLFLEKKVIDYAEGLTTATNTRLNEHPCAKAFNAFLTKDLKSDYESIINCCQRHVCRLSGYCKSSKKFNKCRFGYPLELLEKSHIIFSETKNTVRAKILIKRNDAHLNIHNRLICHHWRANVDMQIILDVSAAINYMVKYATKGS
jgi:hypothetical protein